MTKEIIAIDIDEVLFPFVDEFIKDHNTIYATSLARNQFTSYDFSVPLELDITKTLERVYEIQEQLAVKNILPLKDSIEAITSLSTKYDLSIITARKQQFQDMTKSWISEHFGDVFTSMHFIGYAPIMEKPKTKAEVCQGLGAIALIDDSVEHLLQCPKVGMQGILFGDYPWNQSNSLPDNIVRLDNWPKVLEHFDI